jgi:hypothetical protein
MTKIRWIALVTAALAGCAHDPPVGTIPATTIAPEPATAALAYIYSRDSATEALQAMMLAPDEARRIAANIARLPELLGRAERD